MIKEKSEDSYIYIDYSNQLSKYNNRKTIDMRLIIDKNIENWIDEIIDIKIKVLSKVQKNSIYISLLLINRINLWNSTKNISIKPIIYYLAYRKIKNKKINFINETEDLRNLINNNFKKDNYFNKIYFDFIFYVKVFKNLSKLIIKKLKFIRSDNVVNVKKLIFSSILNKEIYAKKGDHYFGHIFDNSKNNLWVYDDLSEVQKDKSKRMISIMEIITLSSIVYATFENILMRFKNKKILNFDLKILNDKSINNFIYTKFIKELVLNDVRILEIALSKSLEKKLKGKDLDIYFPYEEKPIEKSIVIAANKCGIKTYAYAHAVYSRSHFHLKRNKDDISPRPSKVLLCGKLSQEQFNNFGVQNNQLIIIGSPRYNNKIDYYKKSEKLKLLLIVGQGFEFLIFSSWIINNNELASNYEITIRRYPYGWEEQQNLAEKKLKDNNINYSIGTNDLSKDVLETDIILFESTSAAFEGGLLGRIIVKINISDICTSKHLKCNLESGIDYCKNDRELVDILKIYSAMSDDQLNKKIEHQRVYLQGYYQKIDAGAIK